IPPDQTAAIEVYKEAAAFAPHFIYNVSGVEAYRAILLNIEDNWPAGQPRPYWYEGVATKTREITEYVIEPTKQFPERKIAARMRQLLARNNPILFSQLQTAWQEEYGKGVPDVLGIVGGYDGFYLLAYGLAAAVGAGEAPTGPNLSKGMARLMPPGE